jgi:hypothetical protein
VLKGSSAIAILSLGSVLVLPCFAFGQGTAPRFSLLDEPAESALSTQASLDPGAVLLLDLPSLARPARVAAPGGTAGEKSAGAFTYRLSDGLAAGLSYRHALLFGTATNESLRQQQLNDFTTDQDRDVLKLNMSWDLSLTRFDLGYRIDSTRLDPSQDRSGRYSLLGILPESERTLHSLTFGVTRRWGGAK